MNTVVITWMPDTSGRVQVVAYENADASVLNGVLHVHLHRVNEVTGVKTRTRTWHFPISNIRAWGPEEWGGQHGVLQPGVFDQKED